MDPTFWRDRRVFVTGHTGFKGSWLCLLLRHMGASVTGYALAPITKPSLFDLAKAGEGVETIVADIRDRIRLLAAITEANPEIVIHMAAQALVRTSYSDPALTFETNVMGTVNLLDAVRHAPSVRAVVSVTSDKCYDNREWVWGYRETEPMGGHDPYSSSKGCAELVTDAYRRSFFTPSSHSHHIVAVASARAGNVIGGGDWALDRLVPDIMGAITEGRPVHIRNPHAIRPWQHVLEPLSGYLTLAEQLINHGAAYAEAWNFGPFEDDAIPVSILVQRLTELWGNGASWEIDPAAARQPHEAHYLKLDCSKATARLNWRPRWRLEQTLASIVSFNRAVLDGRDVKNETMRQIEKYLAT